MSVMQVVDGRHHIGSRAHQSARMSSHRSARSDRVEIVTRSERRRWSLEQKREIVAESLGPG